MSPQILLSIQDLPITDRKDDYRFKKSEYTTLTVFSFWIVDAHIQLLHIYTFFGWIFSYGLLMELGKSWCHLWGLTKHLHPWFWHCCMPFTSTKSYLRGTTSYNKRQFCSSEGWNIFRKAFHLTSFLYIRSLAQLVIGREGFGVILGISKPIHTWQQRRY